MLLPAFVGSIFAEIKLLQQISPPTHSHFL